jgi:hypothetical protein
VICVVISVAFLVTSNAATVPAVVPVSVFSVSPLDPDKIREIIPLGNLNPVGGHVFPTDHIYLDYSREAGLVVSAPAPGTVTSIRDQLRGDFKIEIQVDENSSYYLAHLEIEPGIAVGNKVMPGQKLGRTSGKSMLDLGTNDARVRLLGFINPERYPAPTLHAISPLKLFAEPLRSELYAKVKRSVSDKDGRIDLDKPGRLIGNWFREDVAVKDSSRGDPAVWNKQLSFAYDVRDPKSVRISIGGTVAPAGLYGVQEGAPDPAEVGVDARLVRYRLTKLGGSTRANGFAGSLLVQLIDQSHLRIEWFDAGNSPEVKGFTENASLYSR